MYALIDAWQNSQTCRKRSGKSYRVEVHKMLGAAASGLYEWFDLHKILHCGIGMFAITAANISNNTLIMTIGFSTRVYIAANETRKSTTTIDVGESL